MNSATTATKQNERPASLLSPCEVLLALSRSQDASMPAPNGVEVRGPRTTTKPQPVDNTVKHPSADRLRLRTMLEERIEKCQVNISHRNKQLQAMALEKAIYSYIQQQQEQRGQRLVLPRDEASLDEQLRRLQNRLTQQRLRRHSKPSPQAKHAKHTTATRKDAKSPRYQILLDFLGPQRYLRLRSLLEEFQRLGVAQSCCGNSCSDGRHPSSTPRALQGHTQIPPPVRQLFFHTRLLSTVHHTPIHQLPSITHWDELLDEAERHMMAYQAWLQQYDGRGSCCLLVHELCDAETSALLQRTDATEDG